MFVIFSKLSFPEARRRALLRFEKNLCRAFAQLYEDLAAHAYLEHSLRAEADSRLEDFGPRMPIDGPPAGNCPPRRPQG